MAKVLVIGQNGQVSTYLQRALVGASEISDVIVATREQLDLSKPQELKPALDQFDVELIINPAAYTAVDQAEQESALAYTINRDAPGEIADWCAAKSVPLIHFSTDYVFDGKGELPYTEADLPAPNGVYGASKLAGERAIQHTDAQALILRTSWVYSNHGKNFYKTMLALAENRDELSIVADQIGSPTYAGSIAAACTELANQLLLSPNKAADHSGIYHFTCQGETSWHGFASALFAANKVNHISAKPITTAEFPTPAKRPAYSVLSSQKLNDTFGIALPHWQAALDDCVRESV